MLALLPLSVVLAAPVPKDMRPLTNADPPREWKLDDLAAAVPGRGAGPVRVLVWQVIDTKRGFMLERAVVAKELADAKAGECRFVLAYLYRHPKTENPEWRPAEVSGTVFKPNGVPVTAFEFGIVYSKDAADADLAALLARMHWADPLTGDKDRTPELKAGGVVYANWKAAVRRDPPADLFPELKAR